MNMRFFIFLSIILLVSTFVFGQTKTKDIVGTYKFCPYECEFIKLNKDSTFDYFREAHLLGIQRTKGTWKFEKNDKIFLYSPAPELITQIRELESKNPSDKILVRTFDISRALFPGIIISGNYKGKDYRFITGEYGNVEIFRSDEIIISFLQQDKKYKFKNKNLNEVEIVIEPDSNRAFEDFYTIKKNQICYTDDEGVSEFCHEKISKEKSDNIFKK